MTLNKKVTITDISRFTQLSEATISRVLNNRKNVSPSTRQTVLDAIQKLGYVHTPRSQTNNQQIKTIALCMGLFESNKNLGELLANGYYAEVVEGIQAECQRLNINLLLKTVGPHNDSLADLERTIESGNVDALLLVRILNPTFVEQIIDLDIPSVILGTYFPWINIDSVNSEAFHGILLAMQHFIDNGHQRIAYIDGPAPPFNDYWVNIRRLAYQHMLDQYQIPYNPNRVAYGGLTLEGGHRAMREILTNDPSITAVLASNDLSALGASQAIQEVNLSIPADISLIGHDNINTLHLQQLGLTTIDVAKQDMGHIALDLLQSRIHKPDRPIQHILTAESLLLRESVRNLDGGSLKPVNSKFLPYRR